MKSLLAFILSISCLFSQVLLDNHSRLTSYELRIQRKFIQQMRFDSLRDWRAWGIMNAGTRNNLIGGEESFLGLMPQTGLARLYPLSIGKLWLGTDFNALMGRLNSGGEKLLSLGYGWGGHLLWQAPLGFFASLSLRLIQAFQKGYNQWFNHILWLGDIGGGKKFALTEGYFLDMSLFFGSGLISSTQLILRRNPLLALSAPINTPLNFLSVFVVGKTIGEDQVKISISPVFSILANAKVYEETPQGLTLIQKSKAHFDVLLSIDYDVKFSDEGHFYVYADFNAGQLEVMLGAGLRLQIGENRYYPLKYPKIKSEKLKKTHLK